MQDAHEPNGWLRTWVLGILVAGLGMAGLELIWRGQGHRPGTVDDKDLWSIHRARARGGHEKVVLVGQSRIQLGFDTAEFARRYPNRDLVCLAIQGKSCLATLRDLAADDAVRGTILCSVFPLILERCERERQQDFVEHFHEQHNLNKLANRRIASWVQGRSVVVQPRLRLPVVLTDLALRRPLPEPDYVVMHADRTRSADYGGVHLKSFRARRIARRRKAYEEHSVPTPERWRAQVADIRPWIERIQARGGRVVFVRMPTSGEHWQLDQKFYPKAKYWDQLGSIVDCPTFHFDDDARTRGFVCPDASHLDMRDKRRFTAGLLDALADCGLLGEARGTEAAAPR